MEAGAYEYQWWRLGHACLWQFVPCGLRQQHYLCICTARMRTDFIQIPQRVDSVNKNSSDWLVHNNTDQIVPLLDHTTISKCCVNLSLVYDKTDIMPTGSWSSTHYIITYYFKSATFQIHIYRGVVSYVHMYGTTYLFFIRHYVCLMFAEGTNTVWWVSLTNRIRSLQLHRLNPSQ